MMGTCFQSNALHASETYHAAEREREMLFGAAAGHGGGAVVAAAAGRLPLEGPDCVCLGSHLRRAVLRDGGRSLRELAVLVIGHQFLRDDEHVEPLDWVSSADLKIVNLRLTTLTAAQV